MDVLKRLPIGFKGELHGVKLIAFSVDAREVLPHLPNGINPIVHEGRVLFSVVSVHLEKMRAKQFPIPFHYHHVALRLCIEDKQHNASGTNQGIYFFRSFTPSRLMVTGGKLITNYNLQTANIMEAGMETSVTVGDEYLKFALDLQESKKGEQWVYDHIQRIDRAYFTNSAGLFRTVIQRKEWPIRWIACTAFETNIFKSARVEGAFFIDHPIDYEWSKPIKVIA